MLLMFFLIQKNQTKINLIWSNQLNKLKNSLNKH
jgi:hypothetical protein